MARPDIGKEANRAFRHGESRVLAEDDVVDVVTDPNPSPHRDAIHERDDGFGIVVKGDVQTVLGGEELVERVSGHAALVDRANVPTRTECSPLPRDRDRLNVRIVRPFGELAQHGFGHGE